MLCKAFLKLIYSKLPSPDFNKDICAHNRDNVSTHIRLPRRRVRCRHRGQHRGRCDRSEGKLLERDDGFEQHYHERRPAADRDSRDCDRRCHHNVLPRDTEHANSAEHHDGHNGDQRGHRHHDLLPGEHGDISSRNRRHHLHGRGAPVLILDPTRDGTPNAADIFSVGGAV
jgi:hypothetical protein